MYNVATRDHESQEEKLTGYFLQDRKLRERYDKLVAELNTTDAEIKQVAAAKAEIMAQLNPLYKKQTNGKGK